MQSTVVGGSATTNVGDAPRGAIGSSRSGTTGSTTASGTSAEPATHKINTAAGTGIQWGCYGSLGFGVWRYSCELHQRMGMVENGTTARSEGLKLSVSV